MSFTLAQVDQLLHPINTARVLRDGKGHAHVSQQDILAHLIRVFGFGNFDVTVLSTECIFEMPAAKNDSRFDVCYRALVRLTIRDPKGNEVCHYENGSTATAQNQTRGDAHDLAYKSAISLSVKRAAIALGDQFGLSLYNKGQMSALVMGTLVTPELDPWDKATKPASRDMQEGVPQQVSLGNDEIDQGEDVAPVAPPPEARPAPKASSPLLDTKSALAKRMFATINDAGITEDNRLTFISDTIGRPVTTSKEMTDADAKAVLAKLDEIKKAAK